MKPVATVFVEAVEATLAGISVANGFETDAGENVRRGFFAQVLNANDAVFPALVLHPPTEALESVHGTGKKAILQVTVPIVVGVKAEPGTDSFDELQKCIFDVRRALMRNRDALSQLGQADSLEVSGAEPDVSRDLRLIMAAMTASLSIVETYD